jgi:ATP/maltotriose-dependent transcriptional regulator MalT
VIYRKLGVGSRTAAVAAARDLNLVGGGGGGV